MKNRISLKTGLMLALGVTVGSLIGCQSKPAKTADQHSNVEPREEVVASISEEKEMDTEKLAKITPSHSEEGFAGFMIDEIAPGSDWEKAGLKDGDKIVSVGGKEIEEETGINTLVAALSDPNPKIEVHRWVGGYKCPISLYAGEAVDTSMEKFRCSES